MANRQNKGKKPPLRSPHGCLGSKRVSARERERRALREQMKPSQWVDRSFEGFLRRELKLFPE